MIPGTHYTEKGGFKMKPFYMGIDVSKGYADFMIRTRSRVIISLRLGFNTSQ